MVKNFIRNVGQRLKSAFSSKVFSKKQEGYSKKTKTPKSYYRTKAKQQASAKKKR